MTTIGEAVKAKGGSYVFGQQGREVVVDIIPPGGAAMIRVFTSVALGAAEARGCGEDAVRVVVCVATPTGIRALEEPVKILRTAPVKLSEPERVAAFLGRLRSRVRDSYQLARRRPSCPRCARAMARRRARVGGGEFFGCIGYPECTGTVPV